MANPAESLGITANFPSDQFRTAIRFAMQMGKPNAAHAPVHFIKPPGASKYFRGQTEVPASSLKLDRDGMPLDSTVRVVRGTSTEVCVDVAIETFATTEDETPVGHFQPLRAEVTVLDEDYVKIRDCRAMRYNGNRYEYHSEPDVYGLFDVDIHPIIFWAIDEGTK